MLRWVVLAMPQTNTDWGNFKYGGGNSTANESMLEKINRESRRIRIVEFRQTLASFRVTITCQGCKKFFKKQLIYIALDLRRIFEVRFFGNDIHFLSASYEFSRLISSQFLLELWNYDTVEFVTIRLNIHQFFEAIGKIRINVNHSTD